MTHVFTSLRTIAAVFIVGALGINASALAGGHAAAPAAKDIVDTAAGAGSFTTLIAAAKAADLVGALKGDGPLTVFAPTDEAFAALPAGTVENLLKPENKADLQAVLLYHVVEGKVMSSDLSGTINAPTLQGKTIEVIAGSGGVTVNGANVVSADVAASNGVIHVIDAVLLP